MAWLWQWSHSIWSGADFCYCDAAANPPVLHMHKDIWPQPSELHAPVAAAHWYLQMAVEERQLNCMDLTEHISPTQYFVQISIVSRG